jgi:hypothetical protein
MSPPAGGSLKKKRKDFLNDGDKIFQPAKPLAMELNNGE